MTADIEAVLVERLFQRIDLGTRRLDLGLADLGEIFRPDIAGQQADDDHHDEQFEQRESSLPATKLRREDKGHGLCWSMGKAADVMAGALQGSDNGMVSKL